MSSGPFCLYGLACSVNFEWPWCPPPAPEQAARVALVLGDLECFNARAFQSRFEPHAQRPAADSAIPPVVRVERSDDGAYRVAYRDGAEFIIDTGAWEVFGVSRSELTLDDLLVYLQGPILGFVLRLRGVTCLHASGAVVDGRALAVVGRAGIGKSTSAAVFARMGLPVLTDDVLALRDDGDSFHVQPGLPRVLLWPPSAEALFGSSDALPRIVSTWEKCYLDLTQPGYRFAAQPAPLGAVYVLGERISGTDRTQIEPLTGSEALVNLVANTYANDFLDSDMRADEFRVLSRVVQNVPIRTVHAPDDRGAVTSVCQAIIDDFRALGEE